MINKIKNNWYYLLLLIPFVLICIENKLPDNDIWFLLNNGRYIVSNGIPSIDPFTIHEGLTYVMQQWLTSLIFWTIYSNLGKYGLLIFMYIMAIALMYCYYKLINTICNDKKKSVIITTITFCLINKFIVTRPQIFTFLILIIELLLMELYIKNRNNKYLYIMPFLSLLLINLHCSMWYFQFVFMLPFILNTIKIKNITKDSIKLKPLLITLIIMFLVGFINPYGYKALTFIFKSYGINEFNELIMEMRSPSFSSINFKVILMLLFLLIFLLNFNKKFKFDIRHFLFICGVTILAFMHNKCRVYFLLIYFYCFAYGIKDINLNLKILNNKIVKSLTKGFIIGTISLSCFSLIFVLCYTIPRYSDKDEYIENSINYLLDNYNKEDITLYISFNDGGYAEYKGFKSYIDGRAEVFSKTLNNKEDIFKEYNKFSQNPYTFDYDNFINKYHFTHILLYMLYEDESEFAKYLDTNDSYEIVFSDYEDFSDQEHIETYRLYALKEVDE